MIKIHKQITINAPVSTVYSYMIDKPTYEKWTNAFHESSTYIGSFDEGSEISFVCGSDDKNGMRAKIAKNIKNEVVDIEHQGMIKDGVLDTESDEVKKWAGAHEVYIFTPNEDGTTTVTIDQDATEEWLEYMSNAWDKALNDLKTQVEAL